MAKKIKFDETAVVSVQISLTNVSKSLRDVRRQLANVKSMSSEDWTEAERQIFQGNCDVLDAASKEMMVDVKNRIASLKKVTAKFRSAEAASKKKSVTLSVENIFKK